MVAAWCKQTRLLDVAEEKLKILLVSLLVTPDQLRPRTHTGLLACWVIGLRLTLN